MSSVHPRMRRGPHWGNPRQFYGRTHNGNMTAAASGNAYHHHHHLNQSNGFNHSSSYYNKACSFPVKGCREYKSNFNGYIQPDVAPPVKKRKFSASSWESSGRDRHHSNIHDKIASKYQVTYDNGPYRNLPQNNDDINARCNCSLATTATTVLDSTAYTSATSKREGSKFEEDDVDAVFLSRDEIEKCSPSRKDGIDAMHEMHLRYSYCAFLHDVGFQLDLPQTTVGTAMVLCHRFFFIRSHASHDRFLIATAALFLAAKSEETPRPLNNVLKVSCAVLHKKDLTLLSYALPLDWFEQYRERVIEAEQLLLTTLNFELGVQHPYDPLISTLKKLGFSQSALVNLALNLLNEGLRSSLWLQFKPQQIAAGAAYLAAKYLNIDLASYHSVWQEFKTPQSVLKDIAWQLMELY